MLQTPSSDRTLLLRLFNTNNKFINEVWNMRDRLSHSSPRIGRPRLLHVCLPRAKAMSSATLVQVRLRGRIARRSPDGLSSRSAWFGPLDYRTFPLRFLVITCNSLWRSLRSGCSASSIQTVKKLRHAPLPSKTSPTS